MAGLRQRLTARLTRLGLNLSGFVLLLSLPGLWVAWAPWVLWAVTGLGLVAGVVHCGLLWLEHGPGDDPPDRQQAALAAPELRTAPGRAA